jgi:glycerol-3-phosphate dehydrogenase
VDHEREGAPQLVSAIGPKLTTARAIAEQLVDVVCARLGRQARKCDTATAPLSSAPSEDIPVVTARALAADRSGLPDDVVTHLVRGYGAAYGDVMAMVRERPALGERLDAGSPVVAAELAYCARHEMAMRVEDLLDRRTELGQTAHATNAARAAAEGQLRSEASPGSRSR